MNQMGIFTGTVKLWGHIIHENFNLSFKLRPKVGLHIYIQVCILYSRFYGIPWTLKCNILHYGNMKINLVWPIEYKMFHALLAQLLCSLLLQTVKCAGILNILQTQTKHNPWHNWSYYYGYVTQPAKFWIRRIRILYFKSVGFGYGCGFVTRSQLKYTLNCKVHIE